ncbi:MAG: hypothetical protein ACKVX7_11810 [Planctomycetota bacterium]
MLRCIVLAVLFVLTICATAKRQAAADWVVLVDGTQVHGEIILETDRELTLRSQKGGMLSFDLKKVAKIHRTLPVGQPRSTPKEGDPEVVGANDEVGAVSNLKMRRIGEVTLKLPPTFLPLTPTGADDPATLSKPLASQDAVLLGIFEDPNSLARIEVRRLRKPPHGVTEFVQLKQRLTELHRGVNSARFSEQRTDGRSAVFGEVLEAGDDRNWRVLSVYVHESNDTYYQVILRLPEERFHKNPGCYRLLMRSLRIDRETQ